jgi:hypothetical protein
MAFQLAKKDAAGTLPSRGIVLERAEEEAIEEGLLENSGLEQVDAMVAFLRIK